MRRYREPPDVLGQMGPDCIIERYINCVTEGVDTSIPMGHVVFTVLGAGVYGHQALPRGPPMC
jgi:hypothetical protein